MADELTLAEKRAARDNRVMLRQWAFEQTVALEEGCPRSADERINEAKAIFAFVEGKSNG